MVEYPEFYHCVPKGFVGEATTTIAWLEVAHYSDHAFTKLYEKINSPAHTQAVLCQLYRAKYEGDKNVWVRMPIIRGEQV